MLTSDSDELRQLQNHLELMRQAFGRVREERDLLRDACLEVYQETNSCPVCQRHRRDGHTEKCLLIDDAVRARGDG